jgi:hypothetical protein
MPLPWQLSTTLITVELWTAALKGTSAPLAAAEPTEGLPTITRIRANIKRFFVFMIVLAPFLEIKIE